MLNVLVRGVTQLCVQKRRHSTYFCQDRSWRPRVLDAVVEQETPPTDNDGEHVHLFYEIYYDDYRGVILYVRAVDGRLASTDKLL
jgi:translation elongation factor EF-4